MKTQKDPGTHGIPGFSGFCAGYFLELFWKIFGNFPEKAPTPRGAGVDLNSVFVLFLFWFCFAFCFVFVGFGGPGGGFGAPGGGFSIGKSSATRYCYRY